MVFIYNVIGLAQIGIGIFLSAGAYTTFGPWGLLLGPVAVLVADIYWRAANRSGSTAGGVVALLGPRSGGQLFFLPTWLLAVVLLGLAGAHLVDSLATPAKIVVGGATLKRSAFHEFPNGVHGAQYSGRDVQIGVLFATTAAMPTPAKLHEWTMSEYERLTPDNWFTTRTALGACKVGRTTDPPRSFVAVHVCEARGSRVGCAEIDEVAELPACAAGDAGCKSSAGGRLCEYRLDGKAEQLRGAIRAVIGK